MDRRVILAVILMMAIAMLPAVLFKRTPLSNRPITNAPAAPVTAAPPPALPPAPPLDSTVAQVAERVVKVTGPLYTYGVSTRGARLVEATLSQYKSMAKGEGDVPVNLVTAHSDLLGLALLSSGDTVSFQDWDFTPSSESLDVGSGGAVLTLQAARGQIGITVTYRFTPDNYLVGVTGQVTGLGLNGGTLLIGLGPTVRNSESDSALHQRELAIVTKGVKESEKHAIGSLSRAAPTDLAGPFEWVAVKSKYFVAALFAVDSTASGSAGRLTALRAMPTDTRKRPAEADIRASLPLPAAGQFHYALYAGPLEYHRLRAMGHDFYDVNPYGWPGFRTIIRPVAVAGRWLLVKMHSLGIAYGVGLILFGIMVRLALWPLNQKAMRSSMAMQAVQPLMKDLQERYKNDPQKLQQEMFKLYKEHNVNPFGGCWPMLIPMPILLALFFVFQNTIELRGAPFLWISDLSMRDPLFIIPVLMGLSMYLVSKIGQLGMESTPQMKTMLYMMPVMMTVLFFNFPAGLNLYYAVQNVASIPQQWMIAKERQKMAVARTVSTKR
ncbi:MAG TPA: membrane protein insertase YidC [Gemmatimonadales bacterium]|nr:membrane protein insertase YidC [Gemmatimonadales bacterium]